MSTQYTFEGEGIAIQEGGKTWTTNKLKIHILDTVDVKAGPLKDTPPNLPKVVNVGYRLQTIYQTGEELAADVERAKPKYNVTCDSVKMPYSGNGETIVFFSDDPAKNPNPMVRCANEDHPYWKEVEGVVNPDYPGLTQVTPQFVPGASRSDNLTGAPVPTPKPAPAPQPAPETPPTPTSHTDDDSPPRVVDVVVDYPAGETQHSWYTNTLPGRVRGCDTVHYVCRGIPTKSGQFRVTEFQGSTQLRTIAARDGNGQLIYNDDVATNSKNFTFDKSVTLLDVWISNKGSAGEWGDMVLTVGANAKG